MHPAPPLNPPLSPRCDAGGRGQGARQPEAAGRRRPLPVDDLPLRVPHPLAQQHDRPETDPPGVARGGRGPGEEQAPRPGRAQRVARRGEEAQEDVDRRAGEEEPGGVLRGAAEAVGGEDSRDRGEAGPQEERGEGVVLQPAAEAEEDEVRGATLTDGGGRGVRVRRQLVRGGC